MSPWAITQYVFSLDGKSKSRQGDIGQEKGMANIVWTSCKGHMSTLQLLKTLLLWENLYIFTSLFSEFELVSDFFTKPINHEFK